MTFFESLLTLLLAAVLLLQVARRAALPYPAMLALAGVAVAFVPGAPTISIEPGTALALFIAPVLLDAAYDFTIEEGRALWRPIVLLAAGAVLTTTAVVASIGWWAAGMPVAAAIVLGAVVAPPDAAAAIAVLGTVSLPRIMVSVLKGESLFNDAVALLLFDAALTIQMSGGLERATVLRLAIAVPGGVLLGVGLGLAFRWVGRFVGDSLGGNLLQFLEAFLVWIVASHLHLSAVLAIVSFAMTLSRKAEATTSPRMRVHSFAVWSSVTFLLNVLAFLLMGMQARTIIERLADDRFAEAGRIAGLVIVGVILARFAVVMLWNRLAARYAAVRGTLPRPIVPQGTVVAWSGMRGLVTLATAFALPHDFPKRDVVVLAAFSVVLATLVLQGLTLAPLIRLLRLDREEDPRVELDRARCEIANAGLAAIPAGAAEGSSTLTHLLRLEATPGPEARASLDEYRQLGLGAVRAQRTALLRLREEQRLGINDYYLLQEELDWHELSLLPDEQRRMDEA